jgi:hypothetical protein
MKCKILKSFNGSQSGTTSETFTAGTTVELSESLGKTAIHEGWAEAVRVEQKISNKAITTEPVKGGSKNK